MSFTNVMIHAVWGTKNREPLLNKSTRGELFRHIRENALTKNIFIDTIGGYTEHVHCLFELNRELSLSKTMQLLKGEASFWANKQMLIPPKLEWADEYYAVSVSESMLEKVRHYINHQEEHHGKITFAEECLLFLEKWGVQKKPAEGGN